MAMAGGAHLAAAKGTSGGLEERAREGRATPLRRSRVCFGASTMLRRCVTSTLRRAAAAARAPAAAAPSAAPAALRALCVRGSPAALLPRAAAAASTRGFAARAPPAPPSLGDALRAELAHELDVYETPEARHPYVPAMRFILRLRDASARCPATAGA
jgi:hypothetical protein